MNIEIQILEILLNVCILKLTLVNVNYVCNVGFTLNKCVHICKSGVVFVAVCC